MRSRRLEDEFADHLRCAALQILDGRAAGRWRHEFSGSGRLQRLQLGMIVVIVGHVNDLGLLLLLLLGLLLLQ